MKNIILIALLLQYVGLSAQENLENILTGPSDGKCMVYIARMSTMAPIVRFGVYDGEVFLGKLGPSKYFAYECDPGEHIFIAKSENLSYVSADLETGKTYVLEVNAVPGIAIARVSLQPMDKTHKKYEKKRAAFLKFIAKKKGELLIGDEEEKEDTSTTAEDDTPNKMLKKFYEMKEKGKKITTITPDQYFE